MTMRAALTATFLACGLGGAANATTVTFDDLPYVGAPNVAALPAVYGGITWNADWGYFSWDHPPYNASSPPNRVVDATGIQSTLPFSFVSPKVFAGADFAGGAGVEIKYTLVSGGAVVATSPWVVISGTPAFLPSGYAGNVDTVIVDTTLVGHWVMDDVTYSPGLAAAPEPGTWALMLLGLAGVGAGLRFQSRKSIA